MAAASAPPAVALIDDSYREILLRLPADRPELLRTPGRILRYRFGDDAEHLGYVDIPPFDTQEARGTVLMPAADGRLRFASMFGDNTIRFWETEVSADGAVDWVFTKNALLNIPAHGVRLVGAGASSLFIHTEDGGIIRVDVGSGRFQMLPQPAAKRIPGIIPFLRFRTP